MFKSKLDKFRYVLRYPREELERTARAAWRTPL